MRFLLTDGTFLKIYECHVIIFFFAIVYLPKMVLKIIEPCYCNHLCPACLVGKTKVESQQI